MKKSDSFITKENKFKQMKKHQVTIIDIARELGISKSTVSRALSGHPNVHEQTRTKVLRLAEEFEYQRNMFSVNLMRNATLTLGIIVPEFHRSFFPQVIMSAQEAAKEAGYNLVIAQSDENYETEVANTKVMLQYQVDGVLISLTKETQNFDHLKQFERRGIPIVLFNRVCDQIMAPKVIVDDQLGAFAAVEHLIKTGKKRIGHLTGPETLKVCKNRKEGYFDALKKYNIAPDDDLVISYDLNPGKVKIYVNHFLAMEPRPDALFCINDTTAVEVIKHLKIKGLKIPEDIAVVGFSNDSVSTFIEPQLTTVAQPIELLGRTAVSMLIEQIARDPDKWKANTVVLKTTLIIRDSS
ncbi:LacI family DNA-binding transcriptional regulator [Pedobacter frigoris]|uniref:LacI family DNA-binding transcriptional regulator n=1 Tax=Pedobacter frigoris TaxID=2571272 RepID=UPI00292FAE87|nr:LacI family DNA-binding transcriptional regulator [Pedobacter frigoris]